jgi:hypothetical protein
VSGKEARQIKTDLKGWRPKSLLMSNSSSQAWPLAANMKGIVAVAAFLVPWFISDLKINIVLPLNLCSTPLWQKIYFVDSYSAFQIKCLTSSCSLFNLCK